MRLYIQKLLSIFSSLKVLLNNERGNTLLYTLVITPIALSLSTIAIDVNRYSSISDQLQSESSRIANSIVRALPNRIAVETMALELFNPTRAELIDRNAVSEINLEVIYDQNSDLAVGVRLSARVCPGFAKFLVPELCQASTSEEEEEEGANSNLFFVSRETFSSLKPNDYVFIISDSSRLRPGLQKNVVISNTQTEAPWGNLVNWPASDYFDYCKFAPALEPRGNGIYQESETGYTSRPVLDWWNRWDSEDFKRWATQSCFNPVFSNLKSGLINTIDSIEVFKANRVSLIFTPGNNTSIGSETIKNLRDEKTIEGVTYLKDNAGGFASPNKKEVRWDPYFETFSYLGDAACIAFDQLEPLSPGKYSFFSSYYSPNQNFNNLLTNNTCPNSKHSPIGSIELNGISNIASLREAIFYRSAKLDPNGDEVLPNITMSLRQAIQEHFNVPHLAYLEEEKNIRGNIAPFTNKKIVVVSEYIPALDAELISILDQISLSGIDLTLVSYSHEQLDAAKQAELLGNSQALIDYLLLAKTQNNTNGNYNLLVANSSQELSLNILPTLSDLGREIFIKSL